MEFDKIEEMQSGFQTAFINSEVASNLAYKPQFISNNYKEGRKVLSAIEDGLLGCNEFYISAAFITMSGITPMLQTLQELESKGIKGKILTTDYLNFSEPKALKKISELTNIELKMYCTKENGEGFHTKGYIFKQKDVFKIIVGSSNITLGALTKNKEWNTKIISTEQGEYAKQIIEEFEDLWNAKEAKQFADFIELYETNYRIVKEQKKLAKQAIIPSVEQYNLQPNKMQVEFVNAIKKIMEDGESKALLISATGTGKTYASAFAIRALKCDRILFLVHRNQIASQAKKAFRKVFSDNISMGIMGGERRETSADFIFGTMQTMAKEEIYTNYEDTHFDAIIIDEAHHSSANSYQKLMEYFKPKLWLGMTATPDKRQDTYIEKSIYEIFGYKIACEIRLQQAMEEDLLCPFHYFGITDLETISDSNTKEEKLRNFSLLTSDNRVNYVIKKAKYYGYSGDRVKGLVFCSRIDEAQALSKKFNGMGFRTIALTGNDSGEVRSSAIERLAGEESEDALDYIFSVDIFSEGVDITEINQVIMLRPTESPIVFIQQLGRGLRKSEGKEYVVILDFIGNYTNNFMIPIALSGDKTYNKDNIRKYLMEGNRIIPGSSSIHFDEIAKEKIFKSIDKVGTTKKFLIDKYMLLRDKLGHIPTLVEFYQYGEIDPCILLAYAKTYYGFLKMAERDYLEDLTIEEESSLEFVSAILANGKRPHELLILNAIIKGEQVDYNLIKTHALRYNVNLSEKEYDASVSVLEGKFMNTQSEKKRYSNLNFFEAQEKGSFRRSMEFYKRLNHDAYRNMMLDAIQLGLLNYRDKYSIGQGEFVLYEKYSRKDVCRLLNWKQDDSSTLYGYKIKYNTCPIFVTYHKEESISESTKYEDQFLNPVLFSWMTRSTGAFREEAKTIMNYKSSDLKIHLFVKKSDGEGSDFYYMGKVKPKIAKETINTNGAPIINICMELENAVRDDIYKYFTGASTGE